MTIFENSSIITAHNVWENQTTRFKTFDYVPKCLVINLRH